MKSKYILLLLLLTTTLSFANELTESTQKSVFTDSNQWKFDKAQGFVGVSLVSSNFIHSGLALNNYNVSFDPKNTNYPQISTELTFYNSKWFSFFTDYSIGFLRKEGFVSNPTTGNLYSYQNSELLALPLTLGVGLLADLNFFIQPLLKLNLQTIPYRLSSSLTSAETEGHSEASIVALGIKCNTIISSLSFEILVQERKQFGESTVFKSGRFSSVGIGWVF